MTCPVCQRRDLPAEITVCPQCNADLHGMQLVAELQAASAQPSPSRLRAWGPLAVAAAALLGGGLLIGKGIGPTNPSPVVSTAVVAPTTPTALTPTVAMQSIPLAVEPVTPKETAGAFTYVVRPGDTLRGIAWRLYGKASLADRLGKDNGITEPRRLPIGSRLRVFSI